MAFRFRRSSLASLLALLAAPPAFGDVTLNLKDAEIATLITTVSEVTGKNFIVDPRVKGKVTVISSSPMTADGVYETFLAVLEVQGFAAVPAGEAIKIIPDTNARQDGGSYSGTGRSLPKDEIVTHVYEIKNGSASQLVPILRPLVPQWGHLAAYTPSNMLIISDRAANVLRLQNLIATIDRTGDRQVELVRLENAAASEVVRTLTSLQQQDSKTQEPGSRNSVVLADERTNSVVIGGDKNERDKLLEIIKKLDSPLADDGATQVVYLNYADAENLAPILEGYAAQQAKGERPGGQAAGAAAASASGDKAFRIIADPDTNALVITAPPKTMRSLRNVIGQLDIKRAQVLVETVIAEVSATKSSQLGIDWAVYNPNRIAMASILDPTLLSAANAALTTLLTGSNTPTSSAGTSLLGQGATIAGGRINEDGTSFALLLKALAGDGDTNVLSTPSIVTMDNEEAEISVGQEVPFLTGSFSNTGTSSANGVVNPFQTIQRKDVGLTLGITPQVNVGDTITLQLDLEVSSLASGSAGASDLITNKRTISNTVSVESGQILVLGGLMDDNLREQVSGIPFLRSIPFFGTLFSSRNVNKVKSNLMMFIHPVILRGPVEMDYYTRKKYETIRSSQIQASEGGPIPLIGGQRPVLKPFDQRDKDIAPTPQAPVEVQPVQAPAVLAPGAAAPLAAPTAETQASPEPAPQ
jgi:general secretion pathway protein D